MKAKILKDTGPPNLHLRCELWPHLAEDNLWSQVLRSSTQCPSPTFYSFGKAEVRHLKTEIQQHEKL